MFKLFFSFKQNKDLKLSKFQRNTVISRVRYVLIAEVKKRKNGIYIYKENIFQPIRQLHSNTENDTSKQTEIELNQYLIGHKFF